MGFQKKLFLLLVISCGFASCENNEGEISRITERPNDPVEEIVGLQTIYSDSGTVKVL